MDFFIAPFVLAIERRFGYPPQWIAAIGHPVIWFGRLIDLLEQRSNRADRLPQRRRNLGIINLVILLGITLTITLVLQQILHAIPGGFVLEILLATPFLAQKELGRAVGAVAEALWISLDAGREAVSHIVGRDPQALDEAGVSRAAIETLAESTSDGVIAPLFWLVLLGLPGIALYKAINTADSMIGHRSVRYRDYGWASARLDDLVNWIPARLTTVLIVIACFFTPYASPGKAWATARRDAGKHASPNSGWPEASFAGALGFTLGGPRSYAGEMVDLPAFGAGKRDLVGSDILRALQLYRVTLTVTLTVSILLALALFSNSIQAS